MANHYTRINKDYAQAFKKALRARQAFNAGTTAPYGDEQLQADYNAAMKALTEAYWTEARRLLASSHTGTQAVAEILALTYPHAVKVDERTFNIEEGDLLWDGDDQTAEIDALELIDRVSYHLELIGENKLSEAEKATLEAAKLSAVAPADWPAILSLFSVYVRNYEAVAL